MTSRIVVQTGLSLALLSVLTAIVAGLGHRWHWWAVGSSFSILKWAVYGSITALIISAIAMYLTRPGRGQSGFAWSLLACLVSISLISLPAFWLYRARQAPRIHDITTDTQDPPQFVAVVPLRRDAPNPVQYGGLSIAIQQQKAYPDIHSLLMKASPQDTFARALAVTRSLGWEVVASEPDALRIEATDTTFWFGFKDDIVIRIRGMDGGSRLDIRSVSREGISDVGTNARRIRAFLTKMQRGK